MKRFIHLFFLICFPLYIISQTVDLVIFSYDRPMQLYALLESLAAYTTGIETVQIIYRVSDDDFQKGYDEVQRDFAYAIFIKQGNNPRHDFKPLTIKAITESPTPYIIFAVDDIIVKDTINFEECAEALESSGAYGFFLRLGMNLTECYPLQCKQPLPPLQPVCDDIFSWTFNQGIYDWAYPHTVDMTLYHKQDIIRDLQELSYYSPNSLEGSWHGRSTKVMHCKGLCYQCSKIVNLPLNRVQQEYNNRQMNSLQPKDLLSCFILGNKFDIEHLININNTAAHADIILPFIQRGCE